MARLLWVRSLGRSLRIQTCAECYHCRNYWSDFGNDFRCTAVDRRPVESTGNIPDWCPLEEATNGSVTAE